MDKQLLLSATLGDTETAMKLIQDGANINVEGDNGETPNPCSNVPKSCRDS